MSLQTPFGVHKNNEYGRKKGIEAIHHYSHFGMTTVRMQRVALLLHIDIVAEYSLVKFNHRKAHSACSLRSLIRSYSLCQTALKDRRRHPITTHGNPPLFDI